MEQPLNYNQFKSWLDMYQSDKRALVTPDNLNLAKIPLDVAFVDYEIPVFGDFYHIDANSVFSPSTLTIKINSQSNPPIPVALLHGVQDMSIERIFLSNNTAQVGRFVNIQYGLGARITSPNKTDGVEVRGAGYTNSYSFANVIALAGYQPIFLPGVNVNGIDIYSIEWIATVASGVVHFCAGAVPTGFADVICGASSGTPTQPAGKLNQPVRLTPGKGLSIYCQAGGLVIATVVYEIL